MNRLDINRDQKILFSEFRTFLKYRDFSKITSLENYEYKNKTMNTSLNFKYNANISNRSTYIDTKMNTNSNDYISLNSSLYVSNNTSKYCNKIIDKNFSKFSSRNFNNCSNISNPSLTNSQGSSFLNNKLLVEEEMFIKFLEYLIQVETEIDKIKGKLFSRSDFNIIDIFQTFQRTDNESTKESYNRYNYNNFLTKQNFTLGLNHFNVYPTEEEINLCMNRFFYKNRNLNFSQFINMITPLNDGDKKSMTRTSYSKISLSPSHEKNYLSLETEIIIQEFFNKILSSETKAELWRMKLNKMSLFNINEIYEKISLSSSSILKKEIGINELQAYLASHTNFECQLLLKRFDKNDNNKLSYENVLYHFNFSLNLNFFLKQNFNHILYNIISCNGIVFY